MDSKADFLSETNVCGQTLLRIVSRGSAIIAELLRLSNHIPPVFMGEDPKYAPIVFDFKYLTISEAAEHKIGSSSDLMDLDEEFRENHIALLERFYLMFESIYKYIKDYIKFLGDLNDGIFIQQTFEGLLVNQDGKQLLAEAVYLYGVMLTLLDLRIEGSVRERMLISFYRYKGGASIPNIDEVCKLCRSTGFTAAAASTMGSFLPGGSATAVALASAAAASSVSSSAAGASSSSSAASAATASFAALTKGAKVPANYPEEYFARFPIPANVISMLIGRLRSDDIYLQTSYYPSPEHRSTALSTQAAMLYMMLYFQPALLHREQAIMREIVDKHFPDNWVISYYMGFTVDLSVTWLPYKAAAAALRNTVTQTNIRDLWARYSAKLHRCIEDLRALLTEGVLQEDYVLDNIPKLLNCCRESNVTLRWLILHRIVRSAEVRKMMPQPLGVDPEEILVLLLNVSQFEFVLKNMFTALLQQKESKWSESKATARDRMNELAEYFSGEKLLAARNKDESLQAWFRDLASKIEGLDYHDSTLAGRKIQQLISAMEEVEQFHQIESSLQVKQFLGDTRALLHRMIRYVNIREEVLVTIANASDISYAWEAITAYVTSMQSRIKKEPSLVIKLRSTFLKLASILELPLVRILQANSPDLKSVSEYYSAELVSFVRRVLEIIPITMFGVLDQIIDLQTNKLKELPTRLPKAQLKEYAQLDERYQLARATYSVSKFTEGILAMERTLMGIVEVNPKELLEDGIRKELVRQIHSALDGTLIFKNSSSSSSSAQAKALAEFEQKLQQLASKLQGMLRSFEYIQDYVNVYGLRIWQEEFSRIINFNVEQECNAFLKKKVFDWQSQYQSEVIPIPRCVPVDDKSLTFMGRLVRELQYQTDPSRAFYVDQMSAWYDSTGREVVGIRTISQLHSSVGIFGLAGVDKLLSFTIVRDLQNFVRDYRRQVERGMMTALDSFVGSINPPASLPENGLKDYSAIALKTSKLFNFFMDTVIRVGQAQLLRRHIANELNFSCKLDSAILYDSLDALNRALLADVEAHYANPDSRPYPKEGNPLLAELSTYLETSGISSPFTKIYITTDSLEHISALMFIFVISVLPRFQHDPEIDCLVAKKKDDAIDGTPFVVGIISVLKQFHSTHRDLFLAYLGQYVRVHVDAMNLAGIKDPSRANFPTEVLNALLFLEMFCKLAPLPRAAVEAHVPPYLFDRIRQ